jgi:ribonuclease HII
MEKIRMVTARYKLRLKKNQFENDFWAKNMVICGVDEVGRGCLAGPVVTAAVILRPDKKSPLVKDSKLLGQDELLKAYQWIVKNSWFSYGIMNHRVIDAYNIYQATLRAMRRTTLQLLSHTPRKPALFLVDAMPLDLSGTGYESTDVLYFPFGESKSTSIAAASIVAKVTRDAIMRRIDHIFPVYNFARHKGYGTLLHQEALRMHGPSIIHRTTFISNKQWLPEQQLTLALDTSTEESSQHQL